MLTRIANIAMPAVATRWQAGRSEDVTCEDAAGCMAVGKHDLILCKKIRRMAGVGLDCGRSRFGGAPETAVRQGLAFVTNDIDRRSSKPQNEL